MNNGLCKLRDAILVSVLAGGVLGIAGCHQWENNVTKDGIEYTKYRRTENTTNPNRVASIGYLKQETVIGGHKYRGWLHLRGNGTVSGGMLAERIDLNGIGIPADTWISFDVAGNLSGIHLPDNQTIQGHECIGSGGGIKGAVAAFYPTGELRCFFMPETKAIQGVPCRGGVFHMVGLHPNGTLMHCTLAEAIELNGQQYPKGTKLKLAEDGKVLEPRP
jgi:hypothetical protein